MKASLTPVDNLAKQVYLRGHLWEVKGNQANLDESYVDIYMAYLIFSRTSPGETFVILSDEIE